MKTKVAIIGAGPSGLLLSRMLHNRGIESIILENRNEHYLRSRIRAGILDAASLSILIDEGVGDRAKNNSLIHNHLNIDIGSEKHKLDFGISSDFQPRHIYSQTDIIGDLIDRNKQDGLEIIWEAKGQRLEHLTEKETSIHYSLHGKLYTLQCDYVVGCDGWMGICRPTVETFMGRENTHVKFYPYSWYGALVEEDNDNVGALSYSLTEEGFAMHMPTTKCDPYLV